MILEPKHKLWVPPHSVVMSRPWWRQRGFFTPMGFMTAPFKVDAADFDGTNDLMKRGGGLTGAADSKLGLISAWFRLDGGNAANQIILGSTPTGGSATLTFALFRDAANSIRVIGDNASAVTILNVNSTTTYTAAATWHHVLCSWDMTSLATSFLYIDDVDVGSAGTFTNDTLDYTSADWMVGAQADAAAKFNGALAEPYWAPGQFLNISVEANRRKFRTADGKPARLGPQGQNPTGTAPLEYHTLRNGEAVANFAINRGTGGGPYTITGTLDTASTSPSD